MDYKSIPKIELHLHLDGSVRLDTASKITGKSVDELKGEMVSPSKCADLNDYLKRFDLPISIMQSKDNLKLIAHDLAEDLLNDGVIYAEIRFAPNFHTKEGLTLDEVVNSVLEGLREVPIKTNLILCMMRNSTYEENLEIIRLVYRYLGKGVCGIDLAGAEAIYPTANYRRLFNICYALSIPITIHAGEASGFESIDSAIEFDAKRIGHGIRCIDNINTMQNIIIKNIFLEVCPTSNVQTFAVDSIMGHPIKYLYDNGIKVTINTDNRTVSNVTLSSEYELLSNTFGFTRDDFINMNINALNASFLSDEEKEELLKKIV